MFALPQKTEVLPGNLVPVFGWRFQRRGVILPSSSEALRDLIKSKDWVGDLGSLAQAVVEQQLQIYAQAKADTALRGNPTDSAAEIAAIKCIDSLNGASPSEDVETILAIPNPLEFTDGSIWNWEKLPYAALRAAQNDSALIGSSAPQSVDVDEWVLRNERWLRDHKATDWSTGLVKWSAHSDVVFPMSTNSADARTIKRTALSGHTILDEMRPDSIQVQPSVNAFRRVFRSLTGGLLDGMDWSNVFVAGGMVLSALSCIDPVAQGSRYTSSDIDMYIYGLGPVEANAKISHIFDVWKSNLPGHAKDKTLVVRNSRTITFFSEYPIKRVQIILKLVDNPKQVLLNFDLDVCAMGWDGKEVLLLPRAVRALETGYNVFTMHLIEGHYLGERRETQEQRVFKYADKGYGIRFLDSYLNALTEIELAATLNGKADKGEGTKPMLFDMKAIDIKAARWTHIVMNRHFSGDGDDDDRPLNDCDRDWHGSGPPIFAHGLLEEPSQVASVRHRGGCLSGFELLMRHVELWREKVRGKVTIRERNTAFSSYRRGPIGYSDLPAYEWNESFSLKHFQSNLVYFNASEGKGLDQNIEELNYDLPLEDGIKSAKGMVRRTSFAPTLKEVLSATEDIKIYLFMPPSFLDYASDLIRQALIDRGLIPKDEKGPKILYDVLDRRANKRQGSEGESDDGEADEDDGYHQRDPALVCWRINAITAWQQIDRRIDEVYEVLWAFYHSYSMMSRAEETEVVRRFFSEVSRRAIRPTPNDEFMAFGSWVGRAAPNKNKGHKSFDFDVGGPWCWDTDEEGDP